MSREFLFGLAPLKPEGSISIIVGVEEIEDGNEYAINNAKDRLIQCSAKEGFVPRFMTHDLAHGTQVIAFPK